MELIFVMLAVKAIDPVLAVVSIIGVLILTKFSRGYWVILPVAVFAAVLQETILMSMQSYRDFGENGSVIIAFIVSAIYGFLAYRFSIWREKRKLQLNDTPVS